MNTDIGKRSASGGVKLSAEEKAAPAAAQKTQEKRQRAAEKAALVVQAAAVFWQEYRPDTGRLNGALHGR